jgi:Flp pilus assembly pilin Flp
LFAGGLSVVFDVYKSFALKLLQDRKGQDLVEYALLTAFVATVAVAAFPAIANTGTRFSTVLSLLHVAVSRTASQ